VRNVAKSTEERLAVLETENIRQTKDIEEILNEVKAIAAFIYESKGKLEGVVNADLPTRVGKIETRQKIYASIAIIIAGLAATKDWLSNLLFG
jgi:hypothetical protein